MTETGYFDEAGKLGVVEWTKKYSDANTYLESTFTYEETSSNGYPRRS